MYIGIFFTLQSIIFITADGMKSWEEWWAYEGISGPTFWGSRGAGGAWALCSKGKFQSPIDIQPRNLIYDPNLKPLNIDNTRVDGTLINTGHDLSYELTDPIATSFSFSGGPLSYTYRVYSVKMHFGTNDERGSEHTIAGKPFPLEIQIMGYNSDLYENGTQALTSTHGLSVLSILGIIDDTKNSEFNLLVDASKDIKNKGSTRDISSFSLADIIPPSDYYITYEGSITQPSCQETVSWILVNKPLHVTKDQIDALRALTSVSVAESKVTVPLMQNNYRPPMPLNRRPVRTNISPFGGKSEDCAVQKYTYYKVNERLIGV